MRKGYLFKVKTTEDFGDLWKGSVFYVQKESKKYYYGEWASRIGTYNVKVPKDKCKKLDDLK
ncbi:hypothetical protein M0R19_06510 [Candidatus Pacearchaeota archaeon]|nr:hypothetical protein [Candidatus Pacearchaeota archaeon]